MKPEPLIGLFAKTERAKAQIDDLNERVNAFFKASPYEIVTDLNTQASEEVWRFRIAKPLPAELSIVAGEILHNLRSPLDQLLCAIAAQNGRSETGVAFPFGKTIEKFESALGEQKKLPADAHALIRAAQPFPGGNDLLWALHQLNRRDKHRIGLVPIYMSASGSLSLLIIKEGRVLTVGPRSGRHFVHDFATNALRQPIHDRQPRQVTGSDGRKHASFDALPGDEIGGTDDDFELLTCVPGTKLEMHFEPTFNVAFRDIPGFERQPAPTVLNDMRDLVERLLLAFERRFFS